MRRNTGIVKATAVVGIMALTMSVLAGCGANHDANSSTTAQTQPGTSTVSSELPDDPTTASSTAAASEFPYTLVVNDHEYSFPMTYQELLELGWEAYGVDEGKLTMEDFATCKIPAGSSGAPFFGGLGGMSLGEIKNAKVIFDNVDGKAERAVADCPIIGIKFDSKKGYPKGSVSVKSPTGTVTIGESTNADIQALFDGQWFYDGDDGFVFVDKDDDGVVNTITVTVK